MFTEFYIISDKVKFQNYKIIKTHEMFLFSGYVNRIYTKNTNISARLRMDLITCDIVAHDSNRMTDHIIPLKP